MNNKYQKKMTLGILLAGVVLLSIGFAAFSANLNVNTTATYTPDSSDFKVVFSKISTGIDTSDVSPIKTPTTITATNGTIDNSVTPTISNLNANFTEPGQKAVYKFYAYNAGEFEAYLNSITFIGNKTCTATTDVTESLLNEACNSIKMTVQVGNTSTETTKHNITGESIDPKEAALVTVTLEYLENGDVADGNFSVSFSDVSLYYATREGLIQPENERKICQLTNDVDGDKVIDVGDEVTCRTESFYVMPNHENAPTGTETISMLAMYNLNVGHMSYTGGTLGIQNENVFGYKNDMSKYGTVAFSETNYWGDVTSGTFVYNESTSISTYVNAYKTTLIEMGLSEDIIVTLPSYQQLTDSSIGCSANDNSCKSAPSWIHLTSYWTGSAYNNSTLWRLNIWGDYTYGYYSTDYRFGVRPVVIIDKAEIGI